MCDATYRSANRRVFEKSWLCSVAHDGNSFNTVSWRLSDQCSYQSKHTLELCAAEMSQKLGLKTHSATEPAEVRGKQQWGFQHN